MAGTSAAVPSPQAAGEGVPCASPPPPSATSKGSSGSGGNAGLLLGVAMLILSQLLPMPMMLWVSLVVGFVGWWVSGGGSLLGNDDAGNAAARQTGSSSSSSRHTSAATAQQEAAAAAGGGGDGSELSTSGVQQRVLWTMSCKEAFFWLCCNTRIEDEDLGLAPPVYAAGGRSMTQHAKSSTRKPAPPAVPLPAAAAAGKPVSSSTTAVPAVAGDAMPAVAAAAAAATVVAAAAATTQAVAKAAPAAATAPAAGEAPAALTGSAAILAKLRQQRSSGAGAANASLKHDGSKVTVLYASQTGTGQEIARAIHAQCAAQGVPAQVMSMNELGFHNLRPDKTPVVVVVASSTGDGDPPDTAAAAYMALKKSWPAGHLAGVQFSVLGLGDSNYTRFMHVPRTIKSRLQDLGAVCFYPCAEADEVDGLEDTVDPWVEGIVKPLQQALQASKQPQDASSAQPAAAAAAASRPDSAGSKGAGLTPEQSSTLMAAVMHEPSVASAAPAAGVPRVTMELSGASGASGALSGQASLAAEDSAPQATATPPAAAAVATAAAAAPAAMAAAAAGSPPAMPPVKLVNGLAPKGVDLKGVPPLAPCRISLKQRAPGDASADAVREREAGLPSKDQKLHRDPAGDYSAAAPFWANVSDAKLMTAEWSDRTVIHVELDLADSGMRFSPGDAVGVLPHNDPALVAGLLARLGVDGDTVFEVQPALGEDSAGALLQHIAWPCTLRHALTTGTDLTSVPRKSLLRLLAEHCSDADEQRTLLFLTSRAGREAYAEEVSTGQPSLLDLLRRFPSCGPPVDALLDALPPLAPRMYSLTNAPVAAGDGVPGAAGPTRVQFALSVVAFATQYGTRRGVASTWLAKLCRPWLSGHVAPDTPPSAQPEVWVPLFLRRAVSFKPPASLDTPLIMIGPGTGVAPFRGFLQQRLADMQASLCAAPALLYFGCRKPDEDQLYESDFKQLQEAGALTKLRVAFSRAQQHKVYVQHLLREDAAEVAKLIASGGHVYVCGDGAAMAKDVQAALAGILRDQLGVPEAQASQELAAMAKEGRYVRDIWS